MKHNVIYKLSHAIAGADRRDGETRRGFLTKVSAVGAVAAIGPVRFLLYPDAASALAPSSCGASTRCNDMYHEFCCSVVGVNDCPSWTYHGGWWKCSAYTGSSLCSNVDQRYYIDCHSNGFACNCVCALGTCDCRRTCCNDFHYGNCHSDRRYDGNEIVCRKVVCSNPGTLYSVCSTGGSTANETCYMESCTHCL